MKLRRYMRVLGPALLLALGGAYAAASIDWCRWPDAQQPGVLGVGTATAELHVGAAMVELTPPLPITLAGYPPPRPEASKATHPLYARATVLTMGAISVAVVSVEVLTIPDHVADAVREQLASLELSDVWVAATHTHSSFGGYDRRLVAEIVGTGSHREAAELAIVGAAVKAVQEAARTSRPVTVEASEGKYPELLEPRSEGPRPSGELVRLVFRAQEGVAAQWVLFATHPTNVPRSSTELDGDTPGYVSRALEAKDQAPALFLQRAIGNAGAGNAEGEGTARAEAMAKRILEALEKQPLSQVAGPTLSFARLDVIPPPPDASRLVPSLFQRPGTNFICGSASKVAPVSALTVGPYRFLAIPGEATQAAADKLEASARARVVSLVNGYLGYVETPELVSKGEGESRRQYFDAALLEHLDAAAQAVGTLLK